MCEFDRTWFVSRLSGIVSSTCSFIVASPCSEDLHQLYNSLLYIVFNLFCIKICQCRLHHHWSMQLEANVMKLWISQKQESYFKTSARWFKATNKSSSLRGFLFTSVYSLCWLPESWCSVRNDLPHWWKCSSTQPGLYWCVCKGQRKSSAGGLAKVLH